ncbi:MAG: DNA repair protein RecO, partial [Candidatus Saccharimonadales bacterium]
ALKSKLAGGIELFSISDISYIRGKSDLGTLISARLEQHYPKILTDIERVQFGYDLLKTINQSTEDEPESAYFELVEDTFKGLNDLDVPLSVNRLWFMCRLLSISGHMPNLATDNNGLVLAENDRFGFDTSKMSFVAQPGSGSYSPDQIKFLRLAFALPSPKPLARVIEADSLSQKLIGLINLLHEHHL